MTSKKNATALIALIAIALVAVGAFGGLLGGGLFSTVVYQNGKIYLEDTLFLNTPKEFVAANYPALKEIDVSRTLGAGWLANATDKVTVKLQTTKQDCVYGLTPQVGYVGGVLGFGAIKVTEYIPAQPTVDIAYDTYVDGEKVASSSPFTKSEIPISLPYNSLVQSSPTMYLVGQDSTAGQQSCMASGDFIIIEVSDSFEAQATGTVGIRRIFDRSQYFNQKDKVFSGVNFIKIDVPLDRFVPNSNSFRYSNPNMGSAIVRIKLPYDAFNLVAYKPPPAGRAELQGECRIEDAYAAQQTNLQFTYKNIGEGSMFSYAYQNGKYTYVSGALNSGTPLSNGDSRTVQWRVTPNTDASGTNTMAITLTGQTNIKTEIICRGNVLVNPTPNVPPAPKPAPAPVPEPTPVANATACFPIFQKETTSTVGGTNILNLFTIGGTTQTACAPDYSNIALFILAAGIFMFFYGDSKNKADFKVIGINMVMIGAGVWVGIEFFESTFLSYFGGNGIILLAALGLLLYYTLGTKIATVLKLI